MILYILCYLPSPAPHSGVISCYTVLSLLIGELQAMSTETQPSLVDSLPSFTAGLDGLRTDQDPDELSRALLAAFKKRVLYNLYVSSLVGDTKRAKALLEVFDNVRSAIYAVSWINAQGRCTPQALRTATTSHHVTILKQFQQLCSRTELLPTSYIISGELIQVTSGQPAASGTFSDVWEGAYNDRQVAIKALRVFKKDGVRKVKKATHTAFLVPFNILD